MDGLKEILDTQLAGFEALKKQNEVTEAKLAEALKKTEKWQDNADNIFIKLQKPDCNYYGNSTAHINVKSALAALIAPQSNAAADYFNAARDIAGPVMKGAVALPLSGHVKLQKSVTNPSGAGYINTTTVLPLADALLQQSAFMSRVSRVSVRGNVTAPAKSTRATGAWLTMTGGNAITPSGPAFKSLNLSPRFATAMCQYLISEDYLNGGSDSMDQILINDLTQVLAQMVDEAIVSGVGTSQPLGVLNAVGIGSDTYTGTAPTFAELLEMETLLLEANVNLDSPGLAWAVTPAVAAVLKVTAKATGEYAGMVLEDGRIDNIPCVISNAVPDDTCILGDWSQYLLADWGNINLLVDPYSEMAVGGVQIRGILPCDGGPRHAQAFVKYTKSG